MNINQFSIGTMPRILFGAGELARLPEWVAAYGRRVLLLTGGRSFLAGPHWPSLQQALLQHNLELHQAQVTGEPSPQVVDEIVARYAGSGIEVVAGIGGGSVLDAAKAVAALLPFGNSVLDHLEDVGRGIPYTGPSLPFIAVPTTAGTGSEATRNAVLSIHGPAGYKKSFRHDSMVPRIALVDPELLASCPPSLMAAQGMDAFTQLLESYVSARANPFTDALAWSGLTAVAEGFFAALTGGEDEAARQGRAAMAYGALLSGITLAQVGLGSVHGLAQPLGSLFPIPHGVACGTTLAVATAVNLRALQARRPDAPALDKYARVGRLLSGQADLDQAAAGAALVATLEAWTERLGLARLAQYGVAETDIPRIVAAARNNSMKSNPVLLTDEEVGEIVRRRL